MAELTVVITDDGEGFYLTDGSDETEEAASFGDCLEFKGTRYLVETDGTEITVSTVTELPEGSYDEAAEGDDDDSDDAEATTT